MHRNHACPTRRIGGRGPATKQFKFQDGRFFIQHRNKQFQLSLILTTRAPHVWLMLNAASINKSDGWTVGRTDGWMGGGGQRADGRTDGQTHGRSLPFRRRWCARLSLPFLGLPARLSRRMVVTSPWTEGRFAMKPFGCDVGHIKTLCGRHALCVWLESFIMDGCGRNMGCSHPCMAGVFGCMWILRNG